MNVGFHCSSVLAALNSANVKPRAKGCSGPERESSYRKCIRLMLICKLSTTLVMRLSVKL